MTSVRNRAYPQLNVRIPPDLKKALKVEAADSGTSLNEYVVGILENRDGGAK